MSNEIKMIGVKSAEEWLSPVGEAAGLDMFGGFQPPGCKTEQVIKAIQQDAYRAGEQIGMTEAAELALRQQQAGRPAVRSILTARDAKK